MQGAEENNWAHIRGTNELLSGDLESSITIKLVHTMTQLKRISWSYHNKQAKVNILQIRSQLETSVTAREVTPQVEMECTESVSLRRHGSDVLQNASLFVATSNCLDEK